ncbi:hypothetical protein [Mycolicibacterium parafortuitum]|uniref:hypothetical protein n=1 Tax=Mycolicibacterium parafortuitum TaxID=39692 RepID=UPI0009F38FFF|nr:hypothetical protein [Mycolicibacterium parafortuitum]ORB29502.1 hypothetical protein BST38_14805 [Mycolicibacterium parafortuitum]
MNWGDLWEYPLRADVWGNVAEWVGAIATGGAALIAVGYYMFQHRQEKRKQAMLVAVKASESHIKREGEERGRWVMEVEVTNNSAAEIREVRAELVRKSFRATLFPDAYTMFLSSLAEIKQDWENAQDVKPLYFTGGRTVIEPGGMLQKEFENDRMGIIYQLWVIFIDSNSYEWAIIIDIGGQGLRRNKLKQVKYYRGLWERHWHQRRTTRQLLSNWSTNVGRAWWLIWHPAKKRRD